MDISEGRTLRRRRVIGGGIAGGTVAAVILASALAPTAANALDAADPTDPSAAQGQIIQLPADLLGGLDIATLGHTLTSNPSAPGPELGGLDLTALGALSIDVGSLNVPLLTDGTTPGLLQLGDLGSAQSFSSSPTQTQSIASSGTITSGGAIDAGAIDGSVTPGTLDLTGLFDQLDVAGLTDAVLDQASIGIGALASRAESNTDAATSEYRIADLGLDLHSDLVAGLSTTLGGAIQGTLTPVSDLVGPAGALTALATTLVGTVNAIPDVPLVANFSATGGTASIAGLDTVGQTVVTEVLEEPLENTTGSVLVDLADGTISVNLAQLLVETGAGANLNTLPANTPVLSATMISAIQQGITSALTGTHPESLNGKVTSTLATTLNELQATVNVGVTLTNPLTGITLTSGTITVAGTLAQFAGTATPAPTTTTDITLAGLDLSLLLNPVIAAVTSAVATTTGPLVNTALTSVIPLVQPALAALTTPLLATLDPVLQGVLSEIATITINEQPTTGDLGADSFTVRALGVDLLPGVGGGVSLDLGSSTVKSAVAAVAAIDAADTVQAGTDLTVTGSGYPANTEVSVQLTAPGGGNVGGPETVTTDPTGGFTLAYPVPASAEPAAGYTVTATAGAVSATDTTEVTAAAAVDAAPAVQAGTDLAVTGTGWPASSQVSVQLTAPGGAAVGGPELANTDATGFFTLAYPVPAGTPAATGYTVTATAGAQSATDTTEVTDAPVPTVDAAATVQAGTDLGVTGATWPANTLVTVQLTAPGGANVGGPETVTTDPAGGFTLAYPVPASAVPGTGYTVTATAGAATATDSTEVTAAASVDAADTAQAGTDLAVTGANWPASTQVSVQLTAPGGAAVGGPELVTTDPSGGFTLAYPVPATATPGAGYTVTATAGAQSATDTTEITAAAAVDAGDTAQAGTDLPVTGTGWPANSQVTVQLTDPDGTPVGGPVLVTTDPSGGFTVGYPVPATATPGTGYTVTATAGAQSATDTTEITAAATVDADATVEAGSDLGVTGANWPANTEISVQLTAPGGAAIGGPVTTTTGPLGGFSLSYPVPAGTPAGTGYTVTATAGTQTATDTTEVTAAPVVVDAAPTVPAGTNLAVTGSGWPVNSSVSLQLTAPGGGANVGGPVTATTDAFGAFTANYPVPAGTTPGTGYTLTATAGAITATDTTEVTAGDPGDVNTNAAASASASADATADGDPSAQAAAEAAALADATSSASAAATADATAAAVAAATTDASTTASADSTTTANAAAAVAAQAAAQADASDDVNAAASTAADANSAASSESAATSDSSTDASSEASTNANAAASASASANADASSAAVAETAAQAAAYADATAEGSAAADPAAEAASEAAATATASTAATADATSSANAGAAIAAQAAALADATSNTAADTSATSDASTSAAANASAAAIATASTDASSDAVASADASAEINTNASASAAASAQADDDSNAAAQAAAVAAALADATSSASAAADATAEAAAQAAATTDASTDASTTATSTANASAAAAAQAAAQNDATSTSAADASASADADPNASAAAAANASSSATASATAAADASASATAQASASATAQASASADAAADPGAKLGIIIQVPVLERGDRQTAVGTGFAPGETVTGVMTSAPLALGTQVANAQGTVTFTWTIPAGYDLGTHTVTLTGASSGSVAATFQVVASGLATTGGQVQGGWIALAALLLVLGLGAVRFGRRRAQTVATDRMVE
ncbi:choice-of-anchor G family protein [Microbacterium sp. CR_7]|uniref:choice-of-anchor G family protein n=1 Tax=Microbacterium sp. CR_7 TaxID=3055792 RepID=UPI0035BF4050